MACFIFRWRNCRNNEESEFLAWCVCERTRKTDRNSENHWFHFCYRVPSTPLAYICFLNIFNVQIRHGYSFNLRIDSGYSSTKVWRLPISHWYIENGVRRVYVFVCGYVQNHVYIHRIYMAPVMSPRGAVPLAWGKCSVHTQGTVAASIPARGR